MPVVVGEVLDKIAAGLSLEGGTSDLVPAWTHHAEQGLAQARADVRSILRGRGFSDKAIDDWDGLDAVTLTQSLYWAYTLGSNLHNWSDAWVDKLDQRENLLTVAIEALPSGPVGYGPIKVSPDETFRDHRLPADPRNPGKWKRW